MLSLQLAQAGSKLIHSCGNPCSGCDVVLPALLCWSQPSTRILGTVQKALLALEGTFCHPGHGARRNDGGCNSASAVCDMFQGVLKEEFSSVSHLSQLHCVGPCACWILVCSPHESLLAGARISKAHK